MIDPAEFTAKLLFSLGRRLVQFSRRKTPAEQRAETAFWDRAHIVLMNGSCAVCLQIEVDPSAKCPGPLPPR